MPKLEKLKFKTKAFILLLAFFIGVISYASYHFVFDSLNKKQTVQENSLTDNKTEDALQTDFYTIDPCEKKVDSFVPPSKNTKAESKTVSGALPRGQLNPLVVCGTVPDYSETLKSIVSDFVNVKVVVNEIGEVIIAEAVDGPESLFKASVESAKQTRFKPFVGSGGIPMIIEGTLTYRFNGERGAGLYKHRMQF